MENKLSIATLVSAVCLSFSAWAISLDDAKNQGLVGEDSSGYLGLVVQNSEAKAVVALEHRVDRTVFGADGVICRHGSVSLSGSFQSA